MFKEIFVSKEIKTVLATLDELDSEFNKFLMFPEVKSRVKETLLKNDKHITNIMIEQDIKPLRTAYSWINNVSGDMIESGEYHIYRGTLNPMTGDELLQIFDISTDKLFEIGDMDKEKASKHKEDIRRNIKSMG